MAERIVILLAMALCLCGCCGETRGYVQLSKNAGLERGARAAVPVFLPTRHRPGSLRDASTGAANLQQVTRDEVPTEADLAKLKPYSKEWGTALEAMNRAADERLSKKLIICRGCLSPADEDRTESSTSYLQGISREESARPFPTPINMHSVVSKLPKAF